MGIETAIIITVDNRGANKRIAETRAEFANLADTVRRGVGLTTIRQTIRTKQEHQSPLEPTQAGP